MGRDFVNSLFAFDFSGAEFSAQLQVPVLGDRLGFREAFFFGADALVLAREIGGALPPAAIGTLVDVDLPPRRVCCSGIGIFYICVYMQKTWKLCKSIRRRCENFVRNV